MSKIRINNYVLKTKVAISPEEQARGLMFQQWPPPVMAFVYAEPSVNKFWMKNTYVPLDIVFCHRGKVVALAEGKPHCEDLLGDDVPSDLVIELPHGMAAKLGVRQGSHVELMYDVVSLKNKYAITYGIE